MRKWGLILGAALAAVVIALSWLLSRPVEMPAESPAEAEAEVRRGAIPEAPAGQKRTKNDVADGQSKRHAEESTEDEAADDEESAEEKLVDAFDALTDRWMEPAESGVTMTDVDAFVKQFKSVPPSRKEECLQRALNLIPDENVMLLAGVLMDKTEDRELVELVFNDVLNRDEDVKKPILQQIFRDKTHPCWSDVAWILDATGEMPH